ncbi:hypothetical protein EDB81DRAFT_878403 [Dactylonectria macrodidyma]|uniref:Ubiquitin-related modifier 1 n=1 Tax=Dactylonectria macrodidyma TaxID=307937 RepID=A0A9P9FLT0_9HYPO|nr:hypothetical protein EDB81DRAFT_878403 [Dactylonectria macrodidyma]
MADSSSSLSVGAAATATGPHLSITVEFSTPSVASHLSYYDNEPVSLASRFTFVRGLFPDTDAKADTKAGIHAWLGPSKPPSLSLSYPHPPFQRLRLLFGLIAFSPTRFRGVSVPKIQADPVDSLASGGLEMLFSHQRNHALTIPAADKDGRAATIAYLIDYLCGHVMDDSRKDLFVLDNHLRPGILVLINDADWELEGEEAYEVQSGDSILFVSTLHGG